MSIVVFNKYKKYTLDGTDSIDWNTDTIKVALLAGYTPDEDTDDYFDDVSSYEVSGGGYTAGGATITGITVSIVGNTVVVDGNDVTWAENASGFDDAISAVIYKDTGTASTSLLYGYIHLGGNRTNTTAPLTIAWRTAGILTIG